MSRSPAAPGTPRGTRDPRASPSRVAERSSRPSGHGFRASLDDWRSWVELDHFSLMSVGISPLDWPARRALDASCAGRSALPRETTTVESLLVSTSTSDALYPSDLMTNFVGRPCCPRASTMGPG